MQTTKNSLFQVSCLVITGLVLTVCGPGNSETGATGDGDFAERMAAEHATDSPAPTLAVTLAPAGPSGLGEVVYAELDGTPIRGYLARPEGAEAAPGVLVIQEWWGLNDNIRAMADKLAAEGYLALAVDLYEGQVAEDRDTAMQLMQTAMERNAQLERNLGQAAAYLTETAGASSVGVVGWCFGGGWSLKTALLLGDRIDAAVIYYGRVVSEPGELASLTAPILGHFASEDQGIPLESVRKFETALTELGKPATIHIYEGAHHAFANPSGTRYQREAADTAWARTLEFFAEHLH